MQVKVIAVDEQDRVKLSRKAALREHGRRRSEAGDRRRSLGELQTEFECRQRGSSIGRRCFAARRRMIVPWRAAQRTRPMPIDDPSADRTSGCCDQYTEIARLAGGLAHEIKNPLSTIRLNMELLAEDLDEPQTPAQRRALKRIDVVQRECQRLQDLLDDFLNFAKVRRLQSASRPI